MPLVANAKANAFTEWGSLCTQWKQDKIPSRYVSIKKDAKPEMKEIYANMEREMKRLSTNTCYDLKR